MYAVFEDGSRQYRVSEGDVVQVDYRDLEPGAPIEFQRILLCKGEELQIGQPLVDGARVLGEVVDIPSHKIYVQHFRRRKNYRKFRGHRQHYLAVRIRNILLPGMAPPPVDERVAEPPAPGMEPLSAGETPAPSGTPATTIAEETT